MSGASTADGQLDQLGQVAQSVYDLPMTATREISASDAKTRLGELLASLPGEGPVTITRNGRAVGVLTQAADRKSVV